MMAEEEVFSCGWAGTHCTKLLCVDSFEEAEKQRTPRRGLTIIEEHSRALGVQMAPPLERVLF